LGLEDSPLPREGPWSRWVPDVHHQFVGNLDDRDSYHYWFSNYDNCPYDDDNWLDDDNYCVDHLHHRDFSTNG
jgi:hypothetical protein